MRFSILAVSALAALPGALAVDVRKQYLVWFEGGAPSSVVDAARQACQEAGGRVTHIYNLLSGFSAHADADAIDAVRLFATTENYAQYKLHIEEDQKATAYGGF